MIRIVVAAAALAALTALASMNVAFAGPTPAPKDAYAYIGYPNDGQVVPANKPFRVWFGLRYMGVAPKGVKYPNTGHHHLLIDTDCRRRIRRFLPTASICISARAKRKRWSPCRPASTRFSC